MTINRSNKAISTRFHGYNFRSRLEARWAVVFETLGLDWQYEPEGFQAPTGERWLPDFRLNFQGTQTWVEIKPPRKVEISAGSWEYTFPAAEMNLLSRMAAGMPREDKIWGIASNIPDPVELKKTPYIYDGSTIIIDCGQDEAEEQGCDYDHWLCVCPSCREVGLEYNGRSARIKCGCSSKRKAAAGFHNASHDDKNYTADHPDLLAAYAAARGKRFEFGDREVWK